MKRNQKLSALIVTCCIILSSFSAQLCGQNVPANSKGVLVTALKTQLSEAVAKRERLVNKLEMTKDELRSLEEDRRKIQKKQDKMGISGDSFSEIMRALQSQRVQLSIDLAGLNARREAMVREFDKQRQQVELQNSGLIKKLTQLMDLQKQELAQLQSLQSQNSVSERQVNAARKRLLEAEIRLMQAKAPTLEPGAQDMSFQLRDISLDRAEKTARLQKIEQLLAQYATARKDIDTLLLFDRRQGQKHQTMSGLQNDLAGVESLVDQIERELSSLENSQDKY